MDQSKQQGMDSSRMDRVFALQKVVRVSRSLENELNGDVRRNKGEVMQ